MTNLFSQAKATAQTKTTSAKASKVRVTVDSPDFFEKVEMLESLNENMKRDKAKADMLHDEIQQVAKAEWCALYDRTGKNPDSIIVEAHRGANVAQTMFIPQDKYISIDADRAAVLTEQYGETIVEEKTTFAFDNEMVAKYGEVLSRLISESSEISEADKGRLIVAKSSFSIQKGTIDRLNSFSASVEQMVAETRPVVLLKNIEVVRG